MYVPRLSLGYKTPCGIRRSVRRCRIQQLSTKWSEECLRTGSLRAGPTQLIWRLQSRSSIAAGASWRLSISKIPEQRIPEVRLEGAPRHRGGCLRKKVVCSRAFETRCVRAAKAGIPQTEAYAPVTPSIGPARLHPPGRRASSEDGPRSPPTRTLLPLANRRI